MKIVKNNEKVYADLMISNGKIATLDERGTMAEAVAVKDGKILAVGSDEDIAKYKGPDTQAIGGAGICCSSDSPAGTADSRPERFPPPRHPRRP